VNKHKTAMQALELLTQNQVGAIIVVDEKNTFQDTLATADFRGFQRDNSMLLEKPVLEFKEYNSRRKGITCPESTTLHELIALFVNHKAHQICVVDEQGHVKGVVTLTDVLRFIVNTTK